MRAALLAAAASPSAGQADLHQAPPHERPIPRVTGARLESLDAAETPLLDATFRIDIRTIAVTFDYYPDQSVVDAVARLEFVNAFRFGASARPKTPAGR